jgi:hypothetical protein
MSSFGACIRARIVGRGAPVSGRWEGGGVGDEVWEERTRDDFERVEGRIGPREWWGRVLDLGFRGGSGDGAC